MMSDSESELEPYFPEAKKQPVKMLLATEGYDNDQMSFTMDKLQDAKNWLHEKYKNCSSTYKEPSGYCIEELEPGKPPKKVYEYDRKEFYTTEQLEFVDFLCEKGYIEERHTIGLLEVLVGSKFDIRLKVEPTKKKQKTTKTAAKN